MRVRHYLCCAVGSHAIAAMGVLLAAWMALAAPVYAQPAGRYEPSADFRDLEKQGVLIRNIRVITQNIFDPDDAAEKIQTVGDAIGFIKGNAKS